MLCFGVCGGLETRLFWSLHGNPVCLKPPKVPKRALSPEGNPPDASPGPAGREPGRLVAPQATRPCSGVGLQFLRLALNQVLVWEGGQTGVGAGDPGSAPHAPGPGSPAP